jgi:arginine/serine-rich splicing factor 16
VRRSIDKNASLFRFFRAHREKRLANRVISPPSYAARISPTYPSFRKSKSLSKSPSPENTGKITYITSFGDEEESPSTSKPNHVDKSRQGRNRRRNSSSERMVYISKRSYSRERGYKRRRSRSRDSRTKRRSWSRDRYKKSRSRSKGRGRSYRRKRSSSSSTLSSSSSSSSSSRSKSRSSSPKFRKRTPPSPTPSPPGKSKSKSPAPKKESPPKVIPRYYGRKKSDQSSSDLSDSSVKDVEMKVANSPSVVPPCRLFESLIVVLQGQQ